MKFAQKDWATLSKLLDDALDLPAEARAAWVENLAGSFEKLKPTLRRMLSREATAQTDNFLSVLPKLTWLGQQKSLPSASQFREGAGVGPYRLLRELGQGGMSSVWLAERIDGVLNRAVALKLPFLSVHNKSLTERFVRERDILAQLVHPHIARLYDAGVTSTGQPFLALEFVEGVPLTEYCDVQRLPVRQRIDLFLQILGAVQYAHRNLVVHRDLKPSNILVTTEGQARLLDFGIAKLLLEGEAKETELTQVGGRALTPDYASPEQLLGQPVTTASDVYSLGVVLYELLCGNRPYRLKRDSRAALEEAILTADATRPSQSAVTEEMAAVRSATVKRLRHALTGDIDTIVLKALKKTPTERYATADAFMQDLRRYLAGEPVLAMPDRVAYRLGKFFNRHRVATAVASMFVLLIAIGLGLVLREAEIAAREAKTARAVEDFLLQIFQSNTRDQKDPVKARQTTARNLLDIGTAELKNKLDAVPGAKQEILAVLAKMYYELGLSDQAAELNRQRVEVVRSLNGPSSPEAAYAAVDYAQSLYQKGDFPTLKPILTEAKQALDAIHDMASAQRVSLLAVMASVFGDESPEKAIAYAEEAVAICRRRYPGSKDLGDSLNILARARYDLGEYDAAEKLQREAVDTFIALGANDTLIASSKILLAGMQMKVLKIRDAEQNFRWGFEAMRKAGGDTHMYTLHAEFRLGRFLHATSRRVEGLALLQSALEKAERTLPSNDAGVTPQFRGGTGYALLAEGRLTEAAKYIDLALTNRRQNFPGGEMHAVALEADGELLMGLGKYAEAGRLLDEALGIRRKIGGSAGRNALAMDWIRQGYLALATDDGNMAREHFEEALRTIGTSEREMLLDGGALAKLGLADLEERQGHSPDAMRLASDVLATVQRSAVRDYFKPLEADALLRMGRAQHLAGDLRSSRASLESALGLRHDIDSDASPWLAEVQIALADCLIDLDGSTQAYALLAQAKAIHATHEELGEHLTRPLRDLEHRLAQKR